MSFVIPNFKLELDWKETVPTFSDISSRYPNPEEGWVVSVDDENILYRYDADTSTWYPITDYQFTPFSAARNKNKVTNIYLASEDGLFTNITPISLPEDMSLISLVAARSNTDVSSWSAEIHLNLSPVPGASVTVPSGQSQASANNLNIPFSKGDGLQFYMRGTNISNPRVIAFFRRRT